MKERGKFIFVDTERKMGTQKEI